MRAGMNATDAFSRAEQGREELATVIGAGSLARAVRDQCDDRSRAGDFTGEQPLIMIDHGDDAATITELWRVLEALAPDAPPPPIIAQISDRRLRRAVQSRIEQMDLAPRPILVDAAGLVAEYFVARERLFEIAYWRGQSRLHVAVIGFDNLGQSFLDALVFAGIAGDLLRPLIRIVTPDAVGAGAFLHREMPEIDKSAEIVITNCPFSDLGDPHLTPLATAEAALPLTAILLLLDNETDTLQASSAIADLQDRSGFASAPLFIGGPGGREASALATPLRSPRHLGRKIAWIGDLSSIDSLVVHILRGRDGLAKRLHEAYLREHGGETGAGTPWETLSETYRRANRRAAAHFAQKLWTMGFQSPSDPSDVGTIDPVAYENVVKPIATSQVEDDVVRRLARLEHERWCADRRLDGWAYGEARDQTRRRHPSLVSFDDARLTANEIAKAVGQIRFLLGAVLRPAKNGATTRFVVGVTTMPPGAQPGISIDAVRRRLAQEPERFVTVLAAVLTQNELAATCGLLEALDAQGRDFCLVVPEWFPANMSIRDDAVALAPALQKLLTRPQTWIAPIGPAGFFDEDVWEDPSGADTARSALARHIIRRSHALIASAGD